MHAIDVIDYIKNSKDNFDYTLLKNVLLTKNDIVATMTNPQYPHLIENNDGIISHVKQIQGSTNILVTDNSKNTTNFDSHTDGPYYEKVPEIVGLYCINPGLKSSSTYIIDTQEALNSLLDRDLQLLQQLDYTYIGKDGVLYPRSLIEKDPLSGKLISNLSARGFISPKIIVNKDLPNMFDIHNALGNLYYALNKSITYEHHWDRGDLLLFNNNRYIHGRKGSIVDYDRHLLRLRFRIDL